MCESREFKRFAKKFLLCLLSLYKAQQTSVCFKQFSSPSLCKLPSLLAVPNHYPHHLFMELKNVNCYENFSHFSKLFSPGSLLCIRVKNFCLIFFSPLNLSQATLTLRPASRTRRGERTPTKKRLN